MEEEILRILENEIDSTTAINILLSAVKSSFDKPHFNDLDRALIGKSLDYLDEKFNLGEDFIVKVKL